MNESTVMRAGQVLLLALAISACNRESPSSTPPASGPAPVASDQAAPTPVVLEDVLDITPEYIVGISFPDEPVPYPGLAAEMKRYADAARNEFLEAVQSRDADDDDMPYDLSLTFTKIDESPRIVAYAAVGSSFTGGAHGMPILARFVWLPQQGRRLRPNDLVPSATGWKEISAYVREELHSALSRRVDADELDAGQRAQMVKSAGRMIDEGTEPDPSNFADFEPVLDPTGKITALRFVFPPYQVGPYADGVQSVEVPASELLPHVAPEYRDLFVDG